ncbi:MAG: MFS transporter [Bdellovibrionales bacterium]|nr:MFS transporter [Bdellovibrionales bacterium]
MPADLPHSFRSLRSRNIRAFFVGHGLSLIGTWMTLVASSWLVYRLTDSELLLGVVAASTQLPMALTAPFAGVYVDRWERQTVLLWTQALSMLQSIVLAVLTLSGAVTVYHIIILNILQGIVNGFDMPARQAFLPTLVEERLDLPNAIALQSAMFHGARLLGPAVAGYIVALAGEGACFAVDAVSYAAVLYSLWIIQPAVGERERRMNLREALLDGWRYILDRPYIRRILVLVSGIALFGTAHVTLMPVFAKEVLAGGAELYGSLMACSGAGALFGALALATRRATVDVERLVKPMPVFLGGMLMLFSMAQSTVPAALAIFISGFCTVSLLAGCNTLIQLQIEDRIRGRVLSFYGLAFLGMMPLGGLLAGAVAHSIGAPTTVLIAGVLCTIIGFFYQPQKKSESQ